MFLDPAKYTRAQNFDPLPGLGDEVSEVLNYKRFVYDFSVQGGVQGLIKLLDEQGNPAVLPNGSLIMSVIIDHVTALTSGGSATIALGANSTNDLKAATAVASWTGLLAGVPVMTAATAVKVASGTVPIQRNNFYAVGKAITITVATADLTAGKFYAHVVFARSSAT